MAIMKFKNSNGEWMGIPAFKGEPGKDGAIQYKAGDGIKIENDTITAEVTKDYLDGKLEDIGEMGFTPEIADSLPTENIDEKTIYMIPAQDGKGDNIYEEWMYINNKWEMIGSTSVDLTDYYTKDVVDGKIANVRLESENIPIYHIYGELYVSGSFNTISKTSELGGKITEVLQQIYADRDNHRIACVIWHNTQVQAPKPTLAIKTYVDSYNLYSTPIPVYTSSGYYSFGIMQPTISNEVISWSNNYNATVSTGDVLQPSTVLTKSNTNAYTPTNDYNPATKKYVDDECVRATNNAVTKVPSALADKTFQIPTGEQITVSTNYTVENISATHGFALNASGFYESDNKGKSSTYALCKVTFNLSDAVSLPITLINSGEAKYDYGIFSEIDKELANNNSADTANVFRAYNGANDSSTSEQTLTYNMPAGEHFIYIKYRKDNSTNNFNDSLQFKIPAEITSEKLKDFTFASTEYVSNALANVPQGSGDAKGFYTYKMNLGNLGFAGEIDEYGYITHIVTELCKTETNHLINKILTDDINQPLVVIENTNTEADLKTMLLFGFDTNYDPAVMQNLDFTFHGVANYIGSATGSLMMKYENSVMFSGTGIVTDGVWDATAIGIAITTQQSLTTDNTWEYTPTGDYNPATKKYVDEAVAASGGGSAEEIPTIVWDGDTSETGIAEIQKWVDYYNKTKAFLPIYKSKGESSPTSSKHQCLTSINSHLSGTDRYTLGIYGLYGMDSQYNSDIYVDLTTVVVYFSDSTRTKVTGLMNWGGARHSLALQYSGDSDASKKGALTVNNTKEYTPSSDYNPATKKYVDDAIAGIEIPDGGDSETKAVEAVQEYVVNLPRSVTTPTTGNLTGSTSSALGTGFLNAIQDAYNRGYKYFKIHVTDYNYPTNRATAYLMFSDAYIVQPWNLNYNSSYEPTGYALIKSTTFNVNVSIVEGVATCTNGTTVVTIGNFGWQNRIYLAKQDDVITKTNTTSYTPSSDYNPATKKYVDDAVANAGGGISSESDPIFSASEAAKITSTDTANWNSKVDINAVNNAINTTLSSKSYLTSEKDPTVPSWAKQPNKPTYTASEVGALPASTVIPTVPTKLSGFTDDLGTSPKHSHSQYLTAHQDISGKQNKVLYGIADPTSDIGAEGDIYIKYV